ncbi:CubicO group peptidase (beta-lactamase class C family) [Asanoa ferruginea]|uniref:CubicO group peptidase (Beta-lactamase class C family) n=1 Tax=Asanoa ferruginea TaxID=53367 RepID=A0A3D9ZHW7_9ACTN|nr:serine hydrolase domain-containing protein [Asanoa ferruginea]REF96052.1 CubicO group peptidase (beta-lactamase class C family) [Asanoa ferruginea]GIF48086.1 esterase [Asanoa ferruginea]
MSPVTGHTSPAFAPVRDVFAGFFTDGRDSGAGLAVVHRGRLVVDLVGGWRDTDRQRPWTPWTVVAVYSVSKPFAAACLMILVDRGLVGLDDPVHRHWPEFPDDGTTVRHVLAHTAGRPGFPSERPAQAWAEWSLLTADLAGAGPMWTPGTVAAEHALTYGHLVGELVRRVDGRSIGRFLVDEVAQPWQLELSFGSGGREDVADLAFGAPDWPQTSVGTPGSLRHRGLANPAGCRDLAVLNGPLWRDTEVPAVNLHATATAVVRFYAGMLAGGTLDGRRILSEAAVAEMCRVQHDGLDQLLERTVRWSLGFQVEDDGSFGMGGIGGSCGYALPSAGLAIGFVTRHLAEFDRLDELETAIMAVVQE